MKFEFEAPGIEAGFVWFKTNGYEFRVEVSRGRGSETITHNFHMRRPSAPFTFTTEEQEQFCRVGISESLKIGSVMAMGGTIELRDRQWEGELRPYSPNL